MDTEVGYPASVARALGVVATGMNSSYRWFRAGEPVPPQTYRWHGFRDIVAPIGQWVEHRRNRWRMVGKIKTPIRVHEERFYAHVAHRNCGFTSVFIEFHLRAGVSPDVVIENHVNPQSQFNKCPTVPRIMAEFGTEIRVGVIVSKGYDKKTEDILYFIIPVATLWHTSGSTTGGGMAKHLRQVLEAAVCAYRGVLSLPPWHPASSTVQQIPRLAEMYGTPALNLILKKEARHAQVQQ